MWTCQLEEDSGGVIRGLGRCSQHVFAWGQPRSPAEDCRGFGIFRKTASSRPHHVSPGTLGCGRVAAQAPRIRAVLSPKAGWFGDFLSHYLLWGWFPQARGELTKINFFRKIILKFSLFNQPPDIIDGGHLL